MLANTGNDTKYFLLTVDVEDWFQVENFKAWIPFSSWDQRELRVERNVHRLLDLLDSIEVSQSAKRSAHSDRSVEYHGKSTEHDMEGCRHRQIACPVKYEIHFTGDSGHFHPHPPHFDLAGGRAENDPHKNTSQTSCESCQQIENKPNPFLNKGDNGPHATDHLSNEIQFNDSASEFYRDGRSEATNHQLPDLPTSQPQTKRRPKATFFVLGWIAAKLPHLVREIHTRGHEVASHGCNHDLPNKLVREELEQDLTKSKKNLEDITGNPVYGYRSPSFAINDDILKTVQDSGYGYDSSYNSFSLHDRYGEISLNGTGKKGIAYKLIDNFYELPISNLMIRRRAIPWGGGGYFRLLPCSVFSWGIKTILRRQNAYMFYVHPWELDKDQPRVEKASVGFKFRHYTNLGKTHAKLFNLINAFSHCRFITCRQYLSKLV